MANQSKLGREDYMRVSCRRRKVAQGPCVVETKITGDPTAPWPSAYAMQQI